MGWLDKRSATAWARWPPPLASAADIRGDNWLPCQRRALRCYGYQKVDATLLGADGQGAGWYE